MSEYDRRTNTRGDDSRGASSGKVEAEVRKLIRSGETNDYVVLGKLRARFNNDSKMVSSVFDGYKDRLDEITRKVRKFERKINEKYGNTNISLARLVKKMTKYAKKHGFNDAEIDFAKNALLNGSHNSSNRVNLPNTRMAKLFGYSLSSQSFEKMDVSNRDLSKVQDILKLNAEKSGLHQQAILNSLEFKGCSAEALMGKFKRDKDNAYNYVHPVVAAFFLHKIPYLDMRVIMSSISGVVKSRYEGRPVRTQPDYELLWDMCVDPSEITCENKSAIGDLKNRSLLQASLWDAILKLRQGLYYKSNLGEFLTALDNCSASVYDAPDQAYVKDEVSMVRKLFGAFSLRPTVVSTAPLLQNMVKTNPYLSDSVGGITQVTSVPMINLRLPTSLNNRNVAVNIAEALEQKQWFVENNTIVPKTQNILYSRDILVFSVQRRFQTLNIAQMTAPHSFARLPMTVSSFEKINDRVVNFPPRMNVLNDTFELRSVVMVERSKSQRDLIVGTTAGIVHHGGSSGERAYLIYDPQGASIKMRDGSTFSSNNPITWVPKSTSVNNKVTSFDRRASTRGSVFVYVRTHASKNSMLVTSWA